MAALSQLAKQTVLGALALTIAMAIIVMAIGFAAYGGALAMLAALEPPAAFLAIALALFTLALTLIAITWLLLRPTPVTSQEVRATAHSSAGLNGALPEVAMVSLESCVKRHPLLSTGIVAAAGFIIARDETLRGQLIALAQTAQQQSQPENQTDR